MRNIAFLTFCSDVCMCYVTPEVVFVLVSTAPPLRAPDGRRLPRYSIFITRVDVVIPSVAACLVPGCLVDAPPWRLACVPDGCWLLRMRID